MRFQFLRVWVAIIVAVFILMALSATVGAAQAAPPDPGQEVLPLMPMPTPSPTEDCPPGTVRVPGEHWYCRPIVGGGGGWGQDPGQGQDPCQCQCDDPKQGSGGTLDKTHFVHPGLSVGVNGHGGQ